jgi:hypothetical protein
LCGRAAKQTNFVEYKFINRTTIPEYCDIMVKYNAQRLYCKLKSEEYMTNFFANKNN